MELPDLDRAGPQPDNPEFTGWKKRTVLYLSGQNLSMFGSALVQYAILWHITLSTQSGMVLTISILCGFLPQLLVSPFAGVWADRYNRKTLIILADLLTAASTLVLAILFILGYRELWLLFLVSAIRSLGAGVQMPAVSALLPQIVPTDKLMRVNGINSSLQPMVFILSPVAAGALMSFSRLESIFFIDVVTAALAIGLMLLLQVPPLARAASQDAPGGTGYLADIKAGLGYIRDNRSIRSLFIFFAVVMFLIAPPAFLTPLLVARSFGEEVWRLTANEVAFFIGSILGGVIISAWGGFKNHLRTIGLGCALGGIFFAGLGISSNFYVYLVFMFLSGLPMPFINVPTTTLLQETVDPGMQGRVFSVMQMINTTVMPLGMLVFGPLADVVAIELLLVLTGLFIVLPSIWLYRVKPFGRKIDPNPIQAD